MIKLFRMVLAGTFLTAPVILLPTYASANSELCKAMKNGVTWTARSSSSNAGKTGFIKLSGSCAVGASGTASIDWNGDKTTQTYEVKNSKLVIGGKAYKARKKSGGGWVITNTSSPI